MTQSRAGTSLARAAGRAGQGAPGIGSREASHRLALCVSLWGPEWKCLRIPASVSAQAQLSPWTTQPDGHELAILLAQQKMLLITYKPSSAQGRVFSNSELTADRRPPLPRASLELGDPLTPTVATAPPGWKPLLLPHVQVEVHTAPSPMGELIDSDVHVLPVFLHPTLGLLPPNLRRDSTLRGPATDWGHSSSGDSLARVPSL